MRGRCLDRVDGQFIIYPVVGFIVDGNRADLAQEGFGVWTSRRMQRFAILESWSS
jgi:hypothetical protein